MQESPERAFRSALVATLTEIETLPLVRALHADGFAVLERQAGPEAFKLARSREFDVVLWQATSRSPAEIEWFARLQRSRVAVIALLETSQPLLVGACLEAGADACLQLQADPIVVIAQVHAVLRRGGSREEHEGIANGVLHVGDIRVDTDRCEVDRAGAFVPLTATEFRIIEYMARNAGRVLRPHEILNSISDDYQYQAREAQEVFKVHARRIRRKLELSDDEPAYLVNVRGFGYRLEGGRARPAAAPQANTG